MDTIKSASELGSRNPAEGLDACGAHGSGHANSRPMSLTEYRRLTFDPDVYARQIKDALYPYAKAKVLNLLESQLDEGPRLAACKRLAEDIVDLIATEAGNILKRSFTGGEPKRTEL